MQILNLNSMVGKGMKQPRAFRRTLMLVAAFIATPALAFEEFSCRIETTEICDIDGCGYEPDERNGNSLVGGLADGRNADVSIRGLVRSVDFNDRYRLLIEQMPAPSGFVTTRRYPNELRCQDDFSACYSEGLLLLLFGKEQPETFRLVVAGLAGTLLNYPEVLSGELSCE